MNGIIGVDAGGTKTKVALFNRNGEIIDSEIKGVGNPVVDYSKSIQNITQGIDEVLMRNTNCFVKHMVLGIAGIGGIHNKEDLQINLIERYSTQITMINDAQLALECIIKDSYDVGIIAIAGTGSVAIGKNNNTYLMTGGWGHLLGDEGSAYYISINTLKNIITEYEEAIEYSHLSRNILSYLKINSLLDIKKVVYNSSKSEIANISKKVGELAETGDKNALAIICEAADEFSNTVIKLIRKIDTNRDEIILGLRGSVLEKNKIFRNRFKENITAKFDVKFEENFHIENIYGAYYLAKKFIL